MGGTVNFAAPGNKTTVTAPPLQPLGIARKDAAYRYLAEKGADLFRHGRFAEAEEYYRAALKNAEQDKVNGRRLAMLITNLATDLRQQQRYDEAEPLFERAVEIERKTAANDEELMIYTARQYAGLLRETARDASAEAVMESARHSFAAVPTNGRTFLADDLAAAPESGVRDERREELETKARLYDLAHTEQARAPTLSTVPAHDVASELKMLADIEKTYQDESIQQSQMLPSSFSYMSGGPLYSSFGGIYATRGGRFAGVAPRFSGQHHAGSGHHH